MTGHIRTNRRLIRNAPMPSLQSMMQELVSRMGEDEAIEYLSHYPTNQLKEYAANVKLRCLREAVAKETAS